MTTSQPHNLTTIHCVSNPTKYRLPAEWETHERTFMVWPASYNIWGNKLGAVRKDIAMVARAIAKYEPVVVLARPDQVSSAQQALGSVVEVIPIPVDDFWARDTAPVFLEGPQGPVGVDFNFNGWGKKQQHRDDAEVSRAILTKHDLPRIQAPIVAEGGSIETDGLGTLLITESSVVNANRNPRKTRAEIEKELIDVLAIKKVIWLAGVRDKDITDGHVDSLARFLAPGVVVISQPHAGSAADIWTRQYDQAMSVLRSAKDSRGLPLKIVQLPEPNPDLVTVEDEDEDALTSYVNFYIANGVVFVPRFGDKVADERAQAILREHFPGRDVVSLQIDTIATGGGGILCFTHDQPRMK